VIARVWSLLLLVVATASCSGGSNPLASLTTPPGPGVPDEAGVAPAIDAGLDAIAHAAPDTDAPLEAQDEAQDAAADASDLDTGEPEEVWCPAGVEMLPGTICAVLPDRVRSDPEPTLVIFLHGVTDVGSGWQIALIQGMSRYAEHQNFALLAPRAPRQPARQGQAEAYAWRTSNLSPGGEDALLDSWMAAKTTLEGRTGHPFKQVFVMGFSSGAYYASSLALRGRLPVDGYAVFAGGSAPYSRAMVSKVKPRVPIFVGYGTKDRAGSRDARGLVAALRAVRWKHRAMEVRAGHTITTTQFTSALAYLRQENAPAPPPSPPTTQPSNQPRRGSKHRVRPRK
jgi:predicted esterase